MKDKPDDINEQLKMLLNIGILKNSFPLRLRGWVNDLGLFVQLRSAGGLQRLQAGGKFRSCFDALCRGPMCFDASNWKLRGFDQKSWDRHFAHLVKPTYEIARFFDDRSEEGISEQDFATLTQAIEHFQATGEWLGLPKKYGGETVDAVEHKAKNSTEVAPSSAKEYSNRAFDYEASGEYDKAIVEYTKAIELDSNYALAYFSRGLLLMLQGKKADAITNFEKVIELSESTELTRLAKHHISELWL